MKSICVYCGSSDRIGPAYLEAAREMGLALAAGGYGLIYGGGGTGMMGAVANGVLEMGGEVTGVIPAMFNTAALVHPSLSRLEVVSDMHTRKARMAELADGFIALPGGFGTFEELFEILTWAQIGLHHKPIGLLNVTGYFNPLVSLVSHAAVEGFIYSEHQEMFVHAAEPQPLLAAMRRFEFPDGLHRWVDREAGSG